MAQKQNSLKTMLYPSASTMEAPPGNTKYNTMLAPSFSKINARALYVILSLRGVRSGEAVIMNEERTDFIEVHI